MDLNDGSDGHQLVGGVGVYLPGGCGGRVRAEDQLGPLLRQQHRRDREVRVI